VEVAGASTTWGQLTPSAVHTPDGTWDVNNNFSQSWLSLGRAPCSAKPQGLDRNPAAGPGIEGKYSLDYQIVRGVNNLADSAFPVGAGPALTVKGPARALRPAVPPQASDAGVVHQPGRLF